MRAFLVILALFLIAACAAPTEQQTLPAVQPSEMTEPQPVVGEDVPSGEPEESFRGAPVQSRDAGEPLAVNEFTMTAFQFGFDPAEIRVKKGDLVRITVTSTDVEHGFSIKEYNIKERLVPGNPVVIEFIADKPGTFTYFCSVYCGQGHGQMRGTLVVEE